VKRACSFPPLQLQSETLSRKMGATTGIVALLPFFLAIGRHHKVDQSRDGERRLPPFSLPLLFSLRSVPSIYETRDVTHRINLTPVASFPFFPLCVGQSVRSRSITPTIPTAVFSDRDRRGHSFLPLPFFPSIYKTDVRPISRRCQPALPPSSSLLFFFIECLAVISSETPHAEECTAVASQRYQMKATQSRFSYSPLFFFFFFFSHASPYRAVCQEEEE